MICDVMDLKFKDCVCFIDVFYYYYYYFRFSEDLYQKHVSFNAIYVVYNILRCNMTDKLYISVLLFSITWHSHWMSSACAFRLVVSLDCILPVKFNSDVVIMFVLFM